MGPMPGGTGSLLGTTAERDAWIWSVLRTRPSRTLSDRIWPEPESERCGPVADSVTRRWMDVNSQGSSHSTSTDGSGPPLWPPWDPPMCSMAESITDGQALDPMADLSLMVFSNKTDLDNRLVWPFWTISSMMVSDGTTPSVTTEDTLSVRISLLETLTSSDSRTPTSTSLESLIN